VAISSTSDPDSTSNPEPSNTPFDYNAIAEAYDRHRGGRGPYLPALVRLAEESRAKRVLELGSGTGNSARAFLEEYPCTLTGIDRAHRMLVRAGAKGIPADWVNADGAHLPIANGSVNFIFGVLMLHLNQEIAPLLAECHRVLGQGRVAFVTAPQDFIRMHPLNAYFPSFAKIDLDRFQSEEAIAEAMSAVGFTDTRVEITKRDPEAIDQAYVDKVANHFITTLRLVPEDEFAAGLKRLRADVAKKGQLDEPMVWEAAVISGESK